MALNRIVLIGRLTKDVELRYTPTGTAVSKFTLAVERPKYKDHEKETDFINIVVWRQLAELCANYLAKGKMVAVDGRLQINNYETQDGQHRSIAEVVAENVQFLSPKDAGQNEGQSITAEQMGNSDDLPF